MITIHPACDLALVLDVSVTYDPEGTWHRQGAHVVETTGPCYATIYGRRHTLRAVRADRFVDRYHAEIVEAHVEDLSDRDFS